MEIKIKETPEACSLGRRAFSRPLIGRLALCVFLCVAASLAQNSTPPATQPQAPADSQSPDASPAKSDEGDDFVFKKEVEEVILHAVVVDRQNHLITGLDRNEFTVYEDGKLQQVTSFRKERVPVALGILIDNSGSMLPKRNKVNEAALQLVSASQPEDRVFVVNFGEDAFLDQDYTPDVDKLRAALQRVETRGSTALYDAIIAGVDHLSRTSPMDKKVLLVVTDGRDNASQATFQQVLHKLQAKNGPVLYTIALAQDQPDKARPDKDQRDKDRRDKDRRDNDGRDSTYRQSLTTLSEQTGGTAFFPSSLDEVQSIAATIAQDIRSDYVIGYHSSNPHTPGVYHAIQLQALEGATPLRVATRAGYYSGNTGGTPR